MNFKITWRPGAEVRNLIERIEENWTETDTPGTDESSVEMMRRDLFELVGVIKGMLCASEISRTGAEGLPTDETGGSVSRP